MQKARDRTERIIVLSRLVDIRFQGLFTPLAGVLFTFPSRYWFTIGHQVVFSLGRWSSRIPTGFHVSRGTQELHGRHAVFAYGAFTLYGWPFQALRLTAYLVTPWGLTDSPVQPYNPTCTTAVTLHTCGLGWSAFARHYLRNLY